MSQKPAPLRLKRRSDFLRVAKGDRIHSSSFNLQAGRLLEKEPLGSVSTVPLEPPPTYTGLPPDQSTADLPPRFGFTVTKRVGDAVERNRIRRRLKEALRLCPDLSAKPGRDYVIVAKTEALTVGFQALQAELGAALRKSDRPARPKSASRKSGARTISGTQARKTKATDAAL